MSEGAEPRTPILRWILSALCTYAAVAGIVFCVAAIVQCQGKGDHQAAGTFAIAAAVLLHLVAPSRRA